MFLELSEAFVCPRCRPTQGLIVLVDRIEGRRVIEGRLGCPECDLRVPVSEEVVRFDRVEPPPDGDATRPVPELSGAPPVLTEADGEEEAAIRLAALLGAEGTSGYLLTGPGLGDLAAAVARRAGEAEVLALSGMPRPSEPGVTWVVGASPAALPLFTARLAASASLAPTASEAVEAIRVVRVGGRVVLLATGGDVAEVIGRSPVSEVARDEGVLVLRREEGGFEEPFARFRGGPRPRRGDG